MLELLKEKPWLMLVAVGIVVLVAYMQSNHSGSSGVSFSGGGVQAIPVDPNAAAIQEANIAAGQANFSTIASLLLGTKQSGDALASSLAQTSAAEDVGLAQTSAGLQASLAQTQAGITIAGINSTAEQSIAATNASEQYNAARLTYQAQSEVTAANLEAARIEALTQERLSSDRKAEARAKDNTDVFGNVLRFGTEILSLFAF